MFKFVALFMLVAQGILADHHDNHHVETYTIQTLWNGEAITEPEGQAIITFTGDGNGNLRVEVNGTFYNSPKLPEHLPETCPQRSTFKLWNYEVIEVFLMNDNEEYVELEFSPRGQYLVLLLKGKDGAYGEQFLHSLPLRTEVDNQCESDVNCESRWTVSSVIPRDYLPYGVSRFNAFAIHGANRGEETPEPEQLVYSALYPVDPERVTAPNFHTLDVFGSIDLSRFGVDTTSRNELWDAVLGNREYKMSFDLTKTNECSDLTDYHGQVSTWNQRSEGRTHVAVNITDATLAFPVNQNQLTGHSKDLTTDSASVWISFTGPSHQLRVAISPFGAWNAQLFDVEGNEVAVEDNVVENVDCETHEDLGKWTCRFSVDHDAIPANLTHFQAIHFHRDLVANEERQLVATLCPSAKSDSELDWAGCEADQRMFLVEEEQEQEQSQESQESHENQENNSHGQENENEDEDEDKDDEDYDRREDRFY